MTRARRRQRVALWRIGAWGVAAAVALAAVALASQTDIGTRRIDMALNGIDEPNVNAALLAVADQRAAQAEAETRRLATLVLELSADRDRLNARIAGLERNVEDMTGSIARQAKAVADEKRAAPPPSPAPVQAVPSSPAEKPAAAPAEKPSATAPVEPVVVATVRVEKPPNAVPTMSFEPAAVARSEIPRIDPLAMAGMDAKPGPWPGEDARLQKQAAVQPGSQAAPLPPPTDVLLPPVPAAPPAPPPRTLVQQPGKTEYAIELGGTTSVEAARARWAEVKANHGPLVAKLEPAVTVDRRFRSSYRLVAGPLPNYSAALQLCGQFSALKVSCRAVRYAGERLAQH